MIVVERIYPDFSDLTPQVLAENVRTSLALYKEEVNKIRLIPLEEVTFENTVKALEESGRDLDVASSIFFNLLSCNASDDLMALSEDLTIELSDISNEISMDQGLAEKVLKLYQTLSDDPSALSPIDKRLLEKSYRGYKSRGAYLPEEVRSDLKVLRKELSVMTLRFGQNVLKEQNAYRLSLKNLSDIERLPESALYQAKRRAEEEGISGWIFDFSMPSYLSVQKYCDNRAVREKLYRDRGRIGYDATKESSNKSLVYEIAQIRCQIAHLLGFESYADFALSQRMAKTPDKVYDMLNQLKDAYLPIAQKEIAEVSALAKEEGLEGELMPWDWSYYSELYRQKVLSYDEEETRPYFELSKSLWAMFQLATDLYDIKFSKNETLVGYHLDVEVYDVIDNATNELLGTLLTDFYPRKGKQSGAWMTNYVESYKGVRPVVSLVMNFTPPTENKPSLLTYDEVNTMFHEFGHGLHGLLTQVEYVSLSGTNVVRDFVELPSQIMENWLRQPEFLKTFARHYQTEEIIPDILVEAIRKNSLFLSGYACIRQLGFGYLDMFWHNKKTSELPKNIEEIESMVNTPIQLLPTVPGVVQSTSFGHIFSGGYAAGYYGYKWAEILDADAFAEYQKNGLWDRETAMRFRKEILEKGDSEEADILYRNFKGRDATILALIERDQISHD